VNNSDCRSVGIPHAAAESLGFLMLLTIARAFNLG
jgi:hypothetical protein